MAPTAGWYDDPRDPSRLRYWDGAAWTEHVTARQQPPPPAGAMPVFPGAEQAQQQAWQYGQPTPAPPQEPWLSPPPTHPPGAVLTPDGARVTSWVKRFAARLLDGIFVFLASLPLTGYFLYRAIHVLADEMAKGTNRPFSPNADVVKWELVAVAITLVVELGYESVSLRRWGATPGKRLLGISVRRWEQGGRLPWSTIGRRLILIYGLGIVSLVPVVGLLASLAGLLDYLWPL